MATQSKKINGAALTALVVTTAIGSGIFALSSDLAAAASPGAALISWLIVGFGVMMLASCFNNLLTKRSDLEGIFAYGKEGFGPFVGFISGWGYWMSSWLGNVAFATVCMSALGYFFPVFAKDNSPISILVASILAWSLTLLVNHGIESAALMNAVITICKLIPIFTFIVVAAILFKGHVFTAQFWGNMTAPVTIGSVAGQIKQCMMIMMWVFVGIEGATVLSSRAKSRKTAGRATIIGVACLIFIYVLASILPYGYMTRAELIQLKQPAMVYMFQQMVGPWGGAFISIGLFVSIMGAWLSWTMLPAETMRLMAEQGLLPKRFAKENKHGVPTLALMTTACMVQAFMIMLIFAEKAYEFAYSLCTAAIVVCYIIVAAYQIKYSWQNRTAKGNKLQLMIGIFTLIFEVVAITLAGLQYLFVCLVVYIPGIILYMYTKKQNEDRLLSKHEWSATILICSGAVITVTMLLMGQIHL
ncbi:arginine-ornithine antiporter [Secundilactobacillus collinoides]|uniref:Arginine-ornithine antiporter n=2 Tax=Secundilactobacillus collinoides TaxID=33960 RepID=A0A0R2BD55_SECCO|nr:arginine-ornithine antiporter [Secundilactobacillus collinoides]KRM76402.1 arginine ornithine antiporter [Secundilactobacillus collinoides DSM 20515 = JCM 1123]KZL42992.1 amino acid permease [Secundilactobacillus collinoides]